MRRTPFPRNLALLWVLAVAALLAAGCDTSPEPGPLDNPFDPDGPLGGDGLQLRALASGNQIILQWNQPQGLGIVEYDLFRSDTPNTGYEDLAIVPATAAANGTYIYKYPDPTQSHWFLAQAVTADGGFSLTSLATPALAAVGPRVIVGDTVTTLATRYPELTVTVGFGDTLLVAQDSTFAAPVRIPVAGPGLPTVFGLDLGAATDSTKFNLYVKSFDEVGESLVTMVSLPVGFQPTVALATGSATRLARRVVDLKIPALGVEQMRFAGSQADLATASWVPGAAVYSGYELADSANPQQIWGEFAGDFGFNTTASLIVRPDLLQSAAFRLRVPANRLVSVLTVLGEHTAGATQMRISENPNLSDAPWVAYADTAQFTLSPGEGTKRVYAQYRNDWTQSTILSDYCIYVSQGIDVKILVPAAGNVLRGGSTLLVRGSASFGTVATALDSVRLDLGDGLGFREVVGTDNWQLTWNVPTLTADLDRTIRARAWAGAGAHEVTDAITIKISQLTVNVLAPADGARIAGGAPLVVSGTAAPFLQGAAIDSVVVEAGTDHLVASGTATWSTTWDAPTVGADTPVTITATVWAGGEAATRTIGVTVTP